MIAQIIFTKESSLLTHRHKIEATSVLAYFLLQFYVNIFGALCLSTFLVGQGNVWNIDLHCINDKAYFRVHVQC